MMNVIKHFQRDRNGIWTCTSAVDLETVKGRVQIARGTRFRPDTLFMGIDVVGMLEEHYLRQL